MGRFVRCFENPAGLLLAIATILVSLGLVMLYSASGARAGIENLRVQAKHEMRADEDYRFHHGADYFVNQASKVAVGVIIGLLILRFPIEVFQKYSLPILIACFIVLVLVVATPLGVESKGARRWMRLGPITLQPSEFAKIGLVIYMAHFLATRRDKMKSFLNGFLPAVGIMGIFSILIVLERDLGTIILMGCVMLGMWLLAQVRTTHLSAIVGASLPVLILLVVTQSYRMKRILAFLDPEKYALTHAFQLNQSLIAVGSGGWFGQGIGMGLQKYSFLSESHTDFIFAIVAEELGFIGSLAICFLFFALVLVGFRISYKAPDYFSGLLAAGLTLVVGLGAFINFFVVLGLAPTKGLPLPFFSYGGSSILATLICIAILVNISNYTLQVQGSKEVF